ncbi:MAG: hypothetical protein MI922_28260, partial [Bacteroidales bacterium]|nr:hypothetical protein [Bacteroidales bacterium]
MKKINFLFIIGILFCLTSFSTAQVKFPGGRIAMSNDGNYHDKDDIGAISMTMAIIAEAGLGSKLVHVEYNNHVWENNTQWANWMKESVNGSKQRWSFPNANIYNVRGQRTQAKNHLRDEINASSAGNLLWIIAAGPMQTVYDAVAAAQQTKRQYIRFVSHSGWNDNHGKCPSNNCHKGSKTKADILKIAGVSNGQWKQIKDQNGSGGANSANDFHTKRSVWSWMQNNSKEKYRFLYQRGLKKNNFDVSDAGMAYWLVTGGPNGGDQ